LSGVATKKQSRILTYPELKSLKGIGYCRQHLRRMEDAGEFPCRIQLSPGRVGWYEHEIDEWLRKRADARTSKKG
jgi:prophage regulatory protein